MQNISLRSSGMHRKQNFEILGLKVTQQSWLLLFAFSPPFFFFTFLASFFSLAGHLVGFILVERVFRKACRILGLGESKGRWAMEQDFHGDFQVNVTWFFASFSCVLDWIVLILVWFERSLHFTRVTEESCPWTLKLMTSQRVERTWIRTGGYRRFRGEWVNSIFRESKLLYDHPLTVNSSLLRQLALSLWKESSYILPKSNLLNTDAPIWIPVWLCVDWAVRFLPINGKRKWARM